MTAVADAPAVVQAPPATPPSRPAAGFREAFALLRPYRKAMLLAFGLGLATTAVAALQPLVVSSAVDDFAGGLPVMPIVVLFLLLVASALLNGVQQLVLQRSGERFAFDTRERLIRHVYTLPIGVLERRDRADLVTRITGDVSQLRVILSSGLVELATSLIAVVVSIVMMVLIDWLMLVLTALAIVVVFVMVVLIGRQTGPAGLRMQNALGELAGAVSRSLGSIRTIRATVSTKREADVAVDRARVALREGYVGAKLRAAIQTFTGITVQLLLIVVIAIGALRVASGSLTIGQLSAFIMYLMLMIAPITLFAGTVAQLGEAFGALSRIMEIENLPAERDVDPNDARPVPPPGTTTPCFELRGVSFRYVEDDEARWALRDVDLTLPEGRTTAVVGPSGAGKSTLFALLERFYEPTEGSLLFRGEDIRTLRRDELRGQIAYVEQDAPALAGNIRDNLLLGAHTASDERCAEALRRVNLPAPGDSGLAMLETEVGEGGVLLSGGERQRLAIARAFLAEASVLLLDEVTSNLDSNNERIIQDLLRAKTGDQSIVVIAHRLSTVVAADSIVVVDGGRVVAQGTHQELMRGSPLYRQLAHNQLLD